jgi:hypothetical protein
MNPEQHAEVLAEALERWIAWAATPKSAYHANLLAQHSTQVVEAYRRDVGPSKINLKSLMALCYDEAVKNDDDPFEAILRLIAGRTKDCYDHMDDDREIYQDIKEWLEYEATLERHEL